MLQEGSAEKMTNSAARRIWKIRTFKAYPEAHNHLLIGEVLQVGDAYARLRCRTFHFGRNPASLRDIKEGQLMVRVIPWGRVEIVNELPASFDYAQASLKTDRGGEIVLEDEQFACTLITTYEKR